MCLTYVDIATIPIYIQPCRNGYKMINLWIHCSYTEIYRFIFNNIDYDNLTSSANCIYNGFGNSYHISWHKKRNYQIKEPCPLSGWNTSWWQHLNEHYCITPTVDRNINSFIKLPHQSFRGKDGKKAVDCLPTITSHNFKIHGYVVYISNQLHPLLKRFPTPRETVSNMVIWWSFSTREHAIC